MESAFLCHLRHCSSKLDFLHDADWAIKLLHQSRSSDKILSLDRTISGGRSVISFNDFAPLIDVVDIVAQVMLA